MDVGAIRGPRNLLRRLFDAAVDTARPERCVPPYVGEIVDKLPAGGRLIVVGAGKAAAAMARATEDTCKELGALPRLSGFVTTRYGYGLATHTLEVLLAGHPVPDEASQAGATRALCAVRSAGPSDTVLCLLSGGASALWALPAPGVTLAGKQALTKSLLRAGATISEINCVRKHLSAIKGGRLAAAITSARLITLAISDVPGDDPSTIGSGPTVPDPTTLAEARAILTRYRIRPEPEILAALDRPENETLKPGHPALTNTAYRIIAAPKASLAAAAQLATEAGYRVEILGDALEGEARVVAAGHAAKARAVLQRGERTAILSGGELTVTIIGKGRGGPNQEYALGLALALDGTPGIAALAADTDGIDGGSGEANDPAGAIVGPDTLSRARGKGLDAATFLANNDSTGFFHAMGDLVTSGPTRTNVNDFRVILIDP